MGIKTKNHGFGRAIIKDKFKGRCPKSKSYIHTTELNDGLNWNSNNFKSVTEENTLDEFLTSAELAGAEFVAERLNVTLITENNCLPTKEELHQTKKCQEEYVQLLKIPRRPLWDENTTSEELDTMERQTFLEWRRSLAMLSEKEGIILTPYEKNLEFWRQLWRVIEKSDVVVQIVDARNPLFFYCKDLNCYVNEIAKHKVNLLLVNKADFLTQQQRSYWSDYFTSVNIKIIFWSATNQIEEENYENTDQSDHSEVDSQTENTDTEGKFHEKKYLVTKKRIKTINKNNKCEKNEHEFEKVSNKVETDEESVEDDEDSDEESAEDDEIDEVTDEERAENDEETGEVNDEDDDLNNHDLNKFEFNIEKPHEEFIKEAKKKKVPTATLR